jgi:hypothetical protein
VLKGSFDDDRYPANQVSIYDLEKEVRRNRVRIGRQLIMLDAERVYIAFFDLVSADYRHPKPRLQFLA